jgi:hypothetical protein
LLWAILKTIVAKLRPETFDELKQVLLDAWNAIPQKATNKLCQSFSTRLEICLEMNGQSISKHLWRCCDKSSLESWKHAHPNASSWTQPKDNLVDQLFISWCVGRE